MARLHEQTVASFALAPDPLAGGNPPGAINHTPAVAAASTHAQHHACCAAAACP